MKYIRKLKKKAAIKWVSSIWFKIILFITVEEIPPSFCSLHPEEHLLAHHTNLDALALNNDSSAYLQESREPFQHHATQHRKCPDMQPSHVLHQMLLYPITELPLIPTINFQLWRSTNVSKSSSFMFQKPLWLWLWHTTLLESSTVCSFQVTRQQ